MADIILTANKATADNPNIGLTVKRAALSESTATGRADCVIEAHGIHADAVSVNLTARDARTSVSRDFGAYRVVDVSIQRIPDVTTIHASREWNTPGMVNSALDALESAYAVADMPNESLAMPAAQRELYPIQARWDAILHPPTARADAPSFWRHLRDSILEGATPTFARFRDTLAAFGLELWRISPTDTAEAKKAAADAADTNANAAEIAAQALETIAERSGLPADIEAARAARARADIARGAADDLAADARRAAAMLTWDYEGDSFGLVTLAHARQSAGVNLPLTDISPGVSESYADIADERLDRIIRFSVPIDEAFGDDITDDSPTVVYSGGEREPAITLRQAQPNPYLGAIAQEGERLRRHSANHTLTIDGVLDLSLRLRDWRVMPAEYGGADILITGIDWTLGNDASQTLTARERRVVSAGALTAQSPPPFNSAAATADNPLTAFPAYYSPPETPTADMLTWNDTTGAVETYTPVPGTRGGVVNPYPYGGGFVAELHTRTAGTGEARRQASPVIENTLIHVERVTSGLQVSPATYQTVYRTENSGYDRLFNFADGLAGERYRVNLAYRNRWGESPTIRIPLTLSAVERPTASIDALMPRVVFEQDDAIQDALYGAYSAAMAQFDNSAIRAVPQASIIASRLLSTALSAFTGGDASRIGKNLTQIIFKSFAIKNWGFVSEFVVQPSQYASDAVFRNFFVKLGKGRTFGLAFAFTADFFEISILKIPPGSPIGGLYGQPISALDLNRLAEFLRIPRPGSGGGLFTAVRLLSRLGRLTGPVGNYLTAAGQIIIILSDDLFYGEILTGGADGKGREVLFVRIQYQRRLPGETAFPTVSGRAWANANSGFFSNGSRLTEAAANDSGTALSWFQYESFGREEIFARYSHLSSGEYAAVSPDADFTGDEIIAGTESSGGTYQIDIPSFSGDMFIGLALTSAREGTILRGVSLADGTDITDEFASSPVRVLAGVREFNVYATTRALPSATYSGATLTVDAYTPKGGLRWRVAAITELNDRMDGESDTDWDARLTAAGDWTYSNGVDVDDAFGLWVDVLTAEVRRTPSFIRFDPETGALPPTQEGGGG